jgi:hypothetical protein
MTPVKVFISYSWKPIHNKQKVLQLAERLSSDFVHVILDDWDLKEGHDKYTFMEQMVNNPEVHRVLLICNKDYAEKANSKKGGVGIESLIVSDEIYTKADQTKFIPVIFEYDDNNNAYAPTFVKGRIFIDLSTDIVFEENYEKLLRNIFDKPSSKRPPLGTIPSYLLSDEPIYLPTAHKVSTIKNALLSEKKNSPLYIQDYLDTFISSQKLFLIELNSLNQNNFEEIILKKIDEMKVLRDDFINFLEVYLLNSISIDAEKLHDFFEKILSWFHNVSEFRSPDRHLGALMFDNFRYFYYELFLTFSTIMLQKEKFSELAYLLQTPFIITDNQRGEIQQLTFSEFRYYNYTLNEFHNQKHNPKRISVTADTIKQRATEKYNFEMLIEADVLLYYISLFYPNTKSYYDGYWFPETSCYRFYRLKVLSKSISERYFNKIKVLFGVQDKAELVAKSEEIEKTQKGFNDFNYRVPDIKVGLNIEEMCTLK